VKIALVLLVWPHLHLLSKAPSVSLYLW